MDLLVISAVLLSVCVPSTFTRESYRTIDLEAFSMCSYGKEESSIMISPWDAIILKVGHKIAKDGSQVSQSIHRCKVKIQTREEFGLLAVIEDMKLQGRRNKNNGWDCEGDYVKLSTVGSSTWASLLDKLLPGDLFKKKTTEELCGIRHAGSQRFSEVGTSANVLSTLSNNLQVYFHQEQGNRDIVNNSFTIVITTFKAPGGKVFTEECDDRYMCPGNYKYCINPAYVCDGHANCAFSTGGAEESDCPEKGVSHLPMFTATTTIIMTLACIVALGLVICVLFTIVMRIKSRNTTRAGTPIPTSGSLQDATAPPAVERQHTLPGYEMVVMSEIGEEHKAVVPPPPELSDYPPSYEQLYPDGPPKVPEGEAQK